MGRAAQVNDEQGVELYYNYAVTPWFRVTADLQWIDPALAVNRQAWVASFRASIRF